MSWEHGTYGWEAIEQLVHVLGVLRLDCSVEERESGLFRGPDIAEVKQNFRIIRFASHMPNKRWVVEEYLEIDDRDCDGKSKVRYEIYEEGHRPDLEGRLQVLEPC